VAATLALWAPGCLPAGAGEKSYMRGASFGAEAWRLGALDALTGFAGVMAAEGASRPCLPPGPALAAGVLPPRRSAAVSPATARCGAAGDCGTPRLVPWRLRTVACVAGGKAESTAFFSDADDVRRAGVYLGRVWATGGLSLEGKAQLHFPWHRLREGSAQGRVYSAAPIPSPMRIRP